MWDHRGSARQRAFPGEFLTPTVSTMTTTRAHAGPLDAAVVTAIRAGEVVPVELADGTEAAMLSRARLDERTERIEGGEETAEVLGSPRARRRLARALRDLRSGRLHDSAEVAAALDRRRARAHS